MSLDFFRLEKGIHINGEDSDVGIHILKSSGIPAATTEEDAAERGSILFAEDGNGIFYKDTSGAGADKWVKIADHSYIASVLGITEGALNFQAFTGTLLTDDQDAKALFQILETEVEALRTLSGTSAGATDMGDYTGSILTSNETIKENIQELETYAEALGGEVVDGTEAAITTITTVDSVLVDDQVAARWFIVIELDSDKTQRRAYEIFAIHDGIDTADATAVDSNRFSKLKLGAAFNHDIDINLVGTGAAQVLALQITASAAVTVHFTRLKV